MIPVDQEHAQPTARAMVGSPAAPAGWPAWRIRDALAAGELRIVDVVAAHLDRLDEVQPTLNAAVVIRRDAALREAALLQADLDAGAPAGPLCGVPFTVKDVIATAGTTTACGSAAFADNVPVQDAPAVARFRAAGAVLIAKTNCPEFAFGVTTGNPTYGVTRNPWGAHSPGGSSGGEAALVAAGASALGLGTDYGGSVRWPAQCCGVLALRPGLGRVDGTGQLPERGGRMDGRPGPPGSPTSVQRHFQVIGPIARTVRDLGLALSVIAGDPMLAEPPVDRDEGLERVRIGWLTSESSQPVGVGVRSVVAGAAAALAEAGYSVEPTAGLLDGLHEGFNRLRATDDLADLKAALGSGFAVLGPDAAATLKSAPATSVDAAALWADLGGLRADVLRRLETTPVLLFPVAPTTACTLDGRALVDHVELSGFQLMAQCRAVTALGLPALSIPIGTDGGLPVSVQVVAGPGQERLVLRVGLVLEHLFGGWQPPPWRHGPGAPTGNFDPTMGRDS